MKNVFILGSRGYHENYGGWETFVTNLIDNYNDSKTKFYISKITEQDEEVVDVNENICVFPIKIKSQSGFNMFLYSIKSIKYTIEYIKKHNIKNPYIYILGLKSLFYLNIRKNTINKLGGHLIVNPDGLEWKRSKWGKVAKSFFKLSERWMLKACDLIICDSIGIQDYVSDTYPKLSNKTKYIAYGSNSYNFKGIKEKEILKEYNLETNKYCLMVGRCVPENNYELVINEYMKSNIKLDLVIISNIDKGKYYSELLNSTNCTKDKRIKFINGVYDSVKLAVIRKNAYLYIHGHSVGGTNPSLIEALSLTDLNILYDVNFNRYAAQDSALYFKDTDSLTDILNDKKYLDKIKNKKGKEAKDIVNNNFTWEIIVDKYKEIFK